ncbi:MAG: hypothetical protein IJQ00_01675, partial [Kiritimatiellae bacterium]|nr:hypothetical protein [Kiritimatiellia bacterium]
PLMKPHLKLPCTILAAALQLTSHAAVPAAWTNSPGMPPYPIKPVPHGSTVDLAVTLKGYTTPPIADGADVRLWYQTNGMGQAWWSAPATFDGNTITASFGPAQDCGADRVSLFFGAPSNVFASAVLRLTHAPGFAPASLPLPVPVLDFATVELRNLSVLTNGWSFGSTPGDYETVSNRAMRISLPGDDGHPGGVFRPYFNGQAKAATDASNLTKPGQSPYPGKLTLNQRYQEDGEGALTGVWWPTFLDAWNAWHWVASEDYVDDAINNIDIPSPPDLTPYATKTELGSVSETANAAALDAASALRIVLGESVWFAVTNNMRTAEGVIPTLQLWEVRDSVTNLVYDSREEITNTVKALTRELHTELTNRIHDVEKTIPSKAWGNYQSDGTDNPEPGKVAIINPPTVILSGGGTFNKYLEVGDSSLWVLQSSGPVTFGGNTNGNYFAVLDDEGKPHFRVAKTDSYDLPAFISGILPRQSQNHILIYTATTNRHGNAVTEHPTISVCSDLKESVWHEEVDGEIDALGISVSWTRDDTIPAWVATVAPDNYPPNLYFRCKVVQEGGVAVINTAPMRFEGGVQFGNGTYRLVPYTTGGKTYLTLEH